MAGRTGGSGNVSLAYYPFVGTQRHILAINLEVDTVFRLLVDFELRVVRAHMAFPAGGGFARDFLREQVLRMAGCAGAVRTVGVYPSDTGVGPGPGDRYAFAVDLYDRAVALFTTEVGRRAAFYYLAEKVVERADEPGGGSVMGITEFLRLFFMAFCAVQRRRYVANGEPLMFPCVRVAGPGGVASITPDADLAVAGPFPLAVRVYGDTFLFVAIDAGSAVGVHVRDREIVGATRRLK
jgi:hypothetical protein